MGMRRLLAAGMASVALATGAGTVATTVAAPAAHALPNDNCAALLVTISWSLGLYYYYEGLGYSAAADYWYRRYVMGLTLSDASNCP